MVLIVSDLRMGAGDALEDFLLWGDSPAGPADRAAAMAALHERFALFLSLRLRDAQAMGVAPRLVLLGNTFNMWQVQRPGERPVRALARILTAHQPVLAALAHWCDAGGDLDLVIGSHDQPLMDGHAWEMLKVRLPRLNALHGGEPTHCLSDAAIGLYAEYGHRFDPTCRWRNLARPDAGGALKALTRCVLSTLEPMEPWIDKALITAELLLALQRFLPGGSREGVDAALLRGIAALAVVRRLSRVRARPTGDAVEGRLLTAARSLARGHVGRALLAPPPALRFVAFGHPSAPRRVALERGVELMSPGPWCPMARMMDGSPVMEQRLGYAQLLPNGAGGWEASVRQFAAEFAASS